MNNEDWSLSKEREFIENLFCKTFNFFVLFFSIVFAGALHVKSNVKTFVLSIGVVMCILLALNTS